MMFVITLKFSDNKSNAAQFMDAHKQWIKSGFDEGVFLLSGSLHSGGGVVVAHNYSLEELQNRVDLDPFVKENIVTAQVMEFTPAKTDPRLNFLLE